MSGKVSFGSLRGNQGQFKDKEKPAQIRSSNIVAAKGKNILNLF